MRTIWLMRAALRRFRASNTATSGLSFASSGISFALANLILAGQLDIESYGVVALLVAIVMLTASLGMLGADGVINRHPITPDASLFGRVALSATVVGSMVVWLAVRVYDIPAQLAALLVPTIAAVSLTRFCGAFLQARMRLATALFFSNSLNYLLLGIAMVSVFTTGADVTTLMAIVAVLQCLMAIAAVLIVRTRFRSISSDYVYRWREALAYLLVVSSSEVLVQLDRLVTPRVLDLDDLAVLGVLLAIVGPPFRLLHLALGYGLLPVLRRAAGPAERSRLLSRHCLIALSLVLPLWLVMWFGAPALQDAFLPGAYAVSDSLMLAALIAGTIKAFSGIAQAGVAALASTRSMEIGGIVGWACVAIGVLAAGYGSGFGLAGVVYGVGAGWLIRLLVLSAVVVRELRGDAGLVEASFPHR